MNVLHLITLFSRMKTHRTNQVEHELHFSINFPDDTTN